MTKIKKIKLDLENCDDIEIDSKHIRGMVIDEPVRTKLFYDGSLELKEYNDYNFIGIYISSEIFKEESINSMIFPDYKPSPKDMLKRRDITSIHIEYEDGESQSISFNYWDDVPGMLGTDNINQINVFRFEELESYGVAIGIFDQENKELQRRFDEMIECVESHIDFESLEVL